ncbi:ABC transporter family substrate-binding protein [Streptomyces sp. BE20]|uniref:ABC transporter family substrate-binding protein n=1 Tax=Streptomyces sp. BE20 TaxID=3002525 RepID=UPI002E79A4B8|nr:ABC transporter family substrate-binding protein [Streptomyces sp. BE20]MEE1821694.1 ABC transporter family substrate-binding protein [Streptomyces sp. BE20]
MRARLPAAAAALLLALAASAGCSGGPFPAGTAPTPVPAPPAPATVTGDVLPVDRSTVRDGGTLRWAVDAVPATLNVYQPAATADSALLAHALYPALFRPGAHGGWEADPDYLAAAESTPPGQLPQVVTYRLNPRAVWSDGTPLSAADFIAQRAALSGLDPAYTSARPAGYGTIDSIVQGAGPQEVKVTFRQPCAQWRALFGPLYPAAETATAAAFGRPLPGGTAHPTAGPFLVSGYDPAGGRAALVRNPYWWGEPAKADRIDFLAVPAEQRADALEQNRVDIAPLTAAVDHAAGGAGAPAGGGAAQALHRAETLPGVTLHRAAGAALTQLTLNAARDLLTDPVLRRAVARAVDRRHAADAALTPLGLPAAPHGHHLLTGDQDGYRDNADALGATDAGRMLDTAGWKRPAADATRARNGRELALTLLAPAGSATARRTADAVVADLGAAGIAVRVTEAPADTFVRDHLAAGDYDLALFSWPAGPDPAGEQQPVYAKPRPGPDGALRAGTNFARAGTEEIDRLFERAGAEPDPAARQALLQEADVRIWQLGHSVPLFQRPELTAVRAGLAGAGVWGFGRPRFQDVGWSAG